MSQRRKNKTEEMFVRNEIGASQSIYHNMSEQFYIGEGKIREILQCFEKIDIDDYLKHIKQAVNSLPEEMKITSEDDLIDMKYILYTTHHYEYNCSYYALDYLTRNNPLRQDFIRELIVKKINISYNGKDLGKEINVSSQNLNHVVHNYQTHEINQLIVDIKDIKNDENKKGNSILNPELDNILFDLHLAIINMFFLDKSMHDNDHLCVNKEKYTKDDLDDLIVAIEKYTELQNVRLKDEEENNNLSLLKYEKYLSQAIIDEKITSEKLYNLELVVKKDEYKNRENIRELLKTRTKLNKEIAYKKYCNEALNYIRERSKIIKIITN